ncbi:MAG: hypothetical protein ACYC6L_13705 [Anaerolineae bacterium]
MQTVGLYTEAAQILDKPSYFERLQRVIGLNLVIVGFSGELPASVLAKSPFRKQPDTLDSIKAVLARHLDGGYCTDQPELAINWAGPHIGWGGNDQQLQAAVRRAHQMGLRVWLVTGGWTANDYHTLMFCPNDAQVNDWYEAVFTHLAAAYGVEGLDITHARYPMTSELRGLGLCACERCTRAAQQAGIDMPGVIKEINASVAALRNLDIQRLRKVKIDSLGLADAWQLLGVRSGIFTWLQFRADTLARNLNRFRTNIRRQVGTQVVFGADTYPSSMAVLAGHDQTRWDTFSDFASPLISHVDIFVLKTFVAWARWLQDTIINLTEPEALRLVYHLTGYDHLGLPETIERFALGEPDCEFRNIPLRDLLALDMAKARMTLPRGLPSYPIIQGGGAPYLWPKDTIEHVIADAEQLGHQGVMLQGTASLARGI